MIRPNIVLILADDLGYTDIAPYGSEVNTPSLSALAEQGLSFTNYHTAANCAPARAMLLTGVDSHLAGVSNINLCAIAYETKLITITFGDLQHGWEPLNKAQEFF